MKKKYPIFLLWLLPIFSFSQIKKHPIDLSFITNYQVKVGYYFTIDSIDFEKNQYILVLSQTKQKAIIQFKNDKNSTILKLYKSKQNLDKYLATYKDNSYILYIDVDEEKKGISTFYKGTIEIIYKNTHKKYHIHGFF
ncbi:MAG: hypothetical protein JSR12_10705 [Bacteroidetes bacterium]|nr:hypothetical protein [Bacteroidota bacterium]